MTESIEARVAQHYARGDIEGTILAALASTGLDTTRLTQSDLAAVDEFRARPDRADGNDRRFAVSCATRRGLIRRTTW